MNFSVSYGLLFNDQLNPPYTWILIMKYKSSELMMRLWWHLN